MGSAALQALRRLRDTKVLRNSPKRLHSVELPSGPPPQPQETLIPFEALELEICFATPCGEIWLVPQRTSKDRAEWTPRDLALVKALLAAFPGARVRIQRNKGPQHT